MVDNRRYHCYTLVSWVLCFSRRRRADTYSARDCRNLYSDLAIDWQKVVEITRILFFVTFFSKMKIQTCMKRENVKCFGLQGSVRFKGSARVISLKNYTPFIDLKTLAGLKDEASFQ